MNYTTLLIVTVLELLLVAMLVSMGIQLLRARSFAKALDDFERSPESRTFVKKWLFGWQFKLQRRLARASVRALGNRFVTLFYRVAGFFFFLVAVAVIVTIVYQWRLG
jgi:hypothetical protein